MAMNNALQLYDGKLSLITLPIPEITRKYEVLVKICYSGACGTDLHIIDGIYPSAKKLVLGSEIVGVVVKVGEAVHHVKTGDRVCINPYDWCSTCHYCSKGQPQFCSVDGMKTALGHHKDGGMQEYIVVADRLVHPIPDCMTLQQAVFCQSMSNIVRAWENMGDVESDAKILIAGAGIMGLLWASVFHFHGYRDVTISEPKTHRWEMASRLDLGYKVVLPVEIEKEFEASKLLDDDVWGFDAIVDCTGSTKALESIFKWARKGATLVLFGVCPTGAMTSLEPFRIYKKELTIVSSFLNRFHFPRTIKMVHDMTKRYLDWARLDIKAFPLSDYEQAFQSMRNGDCSQVVFKLDSSAK